MPDHADDVTLRQSLCNAAARDRTDIASCIPLVITWIYHRFPRCSPPDMDVQPDRDRQEGRLLRWRQALDQSDITWFRWTPYDTHDLQAIVPEWIRSHAEIYTWRSAVLVVCFNYVHMHHIDRVLRGGFLSLSSRLDDPRWMFAPPDLPTHPRDELSMPEDAPARRRRNAHAPRGRGRRSPVQADPPRVPTNARDRRRRQRMGVIGGLNEV
ncbi:hypothetical protein PIB30_089712 [Stylosanthes scabra]|uniref:Aminotransferase-like plant mobile domain-containing protein n=1 Tax=Stylosanthes scabra TaxID=79078 RepID=A0ABU6YRP1_9FABA|nr:hypothetical protein [Stylosanthes scabra]